MEHFENMIYLFGFLFIIVAPTTEGLKCYYCSGTGAYSDCENASTYATPSNREHAHHDSPIFRKCSSPNDEMCYIETYSSQGSIKSTIRGCSDGETFSFSHVDKPERYQRLFDLTTNNETVCVWDLASLVCLTKCDSIDFCNGPQINTAPGLGHSLLTLTTTLLLIVHSLKAL